MVCLRELSPPTRQQIVIKRLCSTKHTNRLPYLGVFRSLVGMPFSQSKGMQIGYGQEVFKIKRLLNLEDEDACQEVSDNGMKIKMLVKEVQCFKSVSSSDDLLDASLDLAE
ncbi:hypothetical protein PR202_ga04362 [Eleusine coracana subsp. coracana]|uniref:Uncharacterized protein n=1 Tax=Eleusine coracana subsp. coracana TaxID=191504 RepID=A0AAV5BRR3_ELECO|nr:hypothetical protein PR202_ga04362 [Eleusine coracana subsp. coracana]